MENLQKAVEELKNSPTVNIHGKNYSQVSTRINIFRKYFSNATLETEITFNDEFRVIIKAIISIDNQVIATGFAEEVRTNDNSINSTSMIEVCETSAIGRALANFGLGGSEYASANEVGNAINQQSHHNNSYQQNFNQNQSTDQYSQKRNVEDNLNELAGLGINIKQDGSYHIAEGNVFANKEILKGKFGFKWDSMNRQWKKQINMQGAA